MVRRNIFSLCRTPVHDYLLWNITNRILKIIFPDVPEDCVRFRHLVVFGQPESGKTTMLKKLAEMAVLKYSVQDEYIGFRYLFGEGNSNVNIRAGYSLGEVLPYLDDKPVQFLIMDDAARGAHSRRGMGDEIVEDIQNFYDIRHIFEKKRKNGVIIVVWSIQRFKTLDITFRNGHILFFKTAAADPADAAEIKRFVGEEEYGGLQVLSQDIYEYANDKVKAISVVRITWDEKNGVGYVRTGLPMHDYIQWVTTPKEEKEGPQNDYYALCEDFEWEEATYKELRTKMQDKEKQWVDLWYLYYVKNLNPRDNLNEFEKKVGYKRAWIYANLKKLMKSREFMGTVAEIRGRLFEGYLKQWLEKEFGSENVEYHQGKPGHPDILLKNANIKRNKLVKGQLSIAINAKAGKPDSSYSIYKFMPELKAVEDGIAQKACIVFYDTTERLMRLKTIDPESDELITF